MSADAAEPTPDHADLLDAILTGQLLPIQAQQFHLAGLTQVDNPDLMSPQVLVAITGIPPYAPTQLRTYMTYMDLEIARQMPAAFAAALAEAEEGASGLVQASGAGDVERAARAAAAADALRDGPAGR